MNNTLIDKIKEEKGNNASTSLNVPQLSKFINSSSKTKKISFNFSTLPNRSSIASLLSKAKSKEISNSLQLKCIVNAPDDSEPKRIGISPELAQSAPLPINKSKTNDTFTKKEREKNINKEISNHQKKEQREFPLWRSG